MSSAKTLRRRPSGTVSPASFPGAIVPGCLALLNPFRGVFRKPCVLVDELIPRVWMLSATARCVAQDLL